MSSSLQDARPGSTVPINVHALRREGFADDIAIALKDAPGGFKLSGGWIPAGCDTSRATLTIPATATDGAASLNLGGTARVRFSAPAAANIAQLKFVPSSPPDGLSVEEVIPVGEDLAIIVRGGSRKETPPV